MLPAPVDTRPSFRRIHVHLVERLARGEWRPGELMPGENELAREYAVSVGTMRKALDVLQAQGAISRRRGRGTTVRQSTVEGTLFNFFRFRDAVTGKLEPPTDEIVGHGSHPANAVERAWLQLPAGSTVYRIRRLRSIGGRPFLTDTMSFSTSRFEHFTWPVPDRSLSVYQYLEREFGTSVNYVQERLTLAALSSQEARHLLRSRGTPALEIARCAYDIAGLPVEFRRSVAITEGLVYLSELRAAA